ncbi:MAG TPA: polyprenyl synthetase family protein, partial [Yinghuangia sp.]|nr:polyprenyl synthetase family protein [Yinghuangia sp.]
DELRRGRPAVHRRFGTPLAILAGDGLLFAAFEQVARCAERGVPARAVQQAVGVLAAAGRDMAEGVARELGWTTTVQGAGCASALADYAETARLKTAALLRASCEMGALLGGGGARQVRALAAYGQALGIAFQIRDDLLPYTSTAAREGKPADSDLRNARPALPLVLVGALGDARARTRLTALLADDPSARHEELAALLEETGALKQAQVIAQEYALQCHQALDDLPPGPHSQVLRDLIAAVTATDDADADVPGTDIGRQR